MLKVLCWVICDSFFIYALVTLWGEMGAYKLLFLACIAFFTWELYSSVKHLIEEKRGA